MKKKTFKKARVASVFLGFFHIFGYIWFGDFYLSKLSLLNFFNISPGFALLITPFISDALLKSIIIRSIAALLVIIGILNNVYMMIDVSLTAQYFIDIIAIIVEVIKQLIVLFILIIMLRRIINPKLEE